MVAARRDDWGRGMKKLALVFVVMVAFSAFGQIGQPGVYNPFGQRDITRWKLLTESDGINRLLPSIKFDSLESFAGTWYSVGSNVWTNAAGWQVGGGADITTEGEVFLDADGEYLTSPKTSSGYAYGLLDYLNYSADFDVSMSTNGVDWLPAKASGQNVFLRISFASGPPIFGTTAYMKFYSVALYGFDRPAEYGQTNNFIGRDVYFSDPIDDKNPVTLKTLSAELATLRAEVYGQYHAQGDVWMDSNRMMWDTNFYTVGASSNGSVQIGWSRQPVFEIFGGYASFVTPIVQVSGISSNGLTLKTTGSTGFRPTLIYSTNLISGAWVSVPTTNYSSTYPTLADGMYSLTVSNFNVSRAYFKVLATNETDFVTGGTNSAVAKFNFEVQGKSIYSGVPTSTNGLPPYALWCDTNDANRLKVKMP